MDYIFLSDALAAARAASTLDMSDPQIEKWFMDEVKNAFIDEHKMGNLSFYSNKGQCIDDQIYILSKNYDLTITEDEKSLAFGENCVFPCVMLDIDQLLNLAHERCKEAKEQLNS